MIEPTAKEYGIVNRVTSTDDYLNVAGELAAKLAVLPPKSLRTTKAVMKHAQLETMQPVLTLSNCLKITS